MFLTMHKSSSLLVAATSRRPSNLLLALLTLLIVHPMILLQVANLMPSVYSLQATNQQLPQPIFDKSMDLATVKENTPVGEIVYTLRARAEQTPLGSFFKMFYSVKNIQLFSVNETTGDVRVAQPIDREQVGDSITFHVSAVALYSVKMPNRQHRNEFGPETLLTITVLILDENDNPPKIELVKVGSSSYDSSALDRNSFGYSSNSNGFSSSSGLQRSPTVSISVSEGAPVNSVIVDLIEATDVDKATSNGLKAICSYCEPYFRVESAQNNSRNDKLSASIILANPLIYSLGSSVFSLHFIVSDGKFNASMIFEVVVEDVQNKPPKFIGSTTSIVNESVAIDKEIMRIQAIDGDAVSLDDTSLLHRSGKVGRPILYELIGQNGHVNEPKIYDSFKLHPLTGQLLVANRLDRESFLVYDGVLTLRVRARELLDTAEKYANHDDLYENILEKLSPYVDRSPEAASEIDITVILVDVNDNQPHWLNGSEIATLNMNQSPNWHLNLPNDHNSRRIYQLHIRENSTPGTPITASNDIFVYDLDNGANANFNISLEDTFNLFDVEPKEVSGFALVTLKLANHAGNVRMLDFENPNERNFIIELVATETKTNERFRSRAQVQISVIDVNDNAPEFKEPAYQANIREDAPPGKSVVLVQATDRDEVSEQLFYSLHGRSAHLFNIDRFSGLITVANCEPTVNRHSRQPTLNNKQCIDFELQRSHHLMVKVSDGELSSEVPLTVFIDDAIDNPPTFALPVVDVVIEEGAEKLDFPIRVEATDRDHASVLTYSIIEGNFEGLFTINNATGELQLTRAIRLQQDHLTGGPDNYRQQPLNKITLIVQASDGVFKSNCTVRIDVLDSNDNAPNFLKNQYSVEIYESMSPHQVVTTVRAVDLDRGNNARVSYKIQRGSFGQFEIDENTGVITVADQAKVFDASKRANYTLEVVAYDHGFVSKSSSVMVSVHVLNTRRKAPEFKPQIQRTKVDETTLNNTVIHRMTVDDHGRSQVLVFEPGPIEALDKNGQPLIASNNERLETMFSVSTNTGDVMVNSALDHDFAAYVNLTVFVSADPQSNIPLNGPNEPMEEYNPRSIGFLIINVVDTNDNPPIFAAPWTPQQPELSFQMLEDLPVGSVLVQLIASDADSKISHYKIEPPNEYFELVSPQSGTIVNRKLVDYDTLMGQTFRTPASHHRSPSFVSSNGSSIHGTNSGNNMIQFNLYAFDSGSPQRYAKAIVSVEILPVNDWDCKFEQSTYEARIKENAPQDTLVTQVRANDLDYGEAHNSVRYQLVGEYSNYFNIDMRSGLITISLTGSQNLDRERLSQPTLTLTVIGRDDLHQAVSGQLTSSRVGKNIQQHGGLSQRLVRTCSSSLKVHIENVNDNPPLFSQKVYYVTTYDTDAIEVPLVRLFVRDDDTLGPLQSNSTAKLAQVNTFRIVSGNIDDSFNITSTGIVYATKPFDETLLPNNGMIQLRVEVKQNSPNIATGVLTSYTDECLVMISYLKINRYGPEWRFEQKRPITVVENSRPGTLVTQLKCVDKDVEQARGKIFDREDSSSSDHPNPIRYWIKQNGSNVLDTREFHLDSVSGNLTTRIELDREAQEFYQLIITCEDNGKPQSLESITPIVITVLDVDDRKPEFIVPRNQELPDQIPRNADMKLSPNKPQLPTIRFSVEEHQVKGLPIGEVKAIDRDSESHTPISYCLIEGNEFREFVLDRATGILYTNQSLDRERQSSYDLIVKAINDGSTCDDHIVNSNQTQSDLNGRSIAANAHSAGSYLSVKVDVLDINDNGPTFSQQVHRAGVHHRSLMNTLVTQVAPFDPDLGINGTSNLRISEIFMYKTGNFQPNHLSSRKYDSSSEQAFLSKPAKLVQSPFRIDQQGNIYTQQLLTQYQLMSMFVLHIEASEQSEPWRTAKTRLEIYTYETGHQLKIRINLHPRLVEIYKSEVESLLSNATHYTAIINRARSYGTNSNSPSSQSGSPPSHRGQNDVSSSPIQLQNLAGASDEASYTNLHLIFVENFKIVNPNLVMEKFDLTSAQLFMPQLLNHKANQLGSIGSRPGIRKEEASQRGVNSEKQQLDPNEVASLIDKIALASVQSTEYHSSASTMAGVDWLESPAALYVSLSIMLIVIGFVIFLFGCCCTSRIKDHIIKNAMNKLVKQQNLQTKINEQVLAAANQNGASSTNNQEYVLQQGGFMSSFDATKGCIADNDQNMDILQNGEFIYPNYTSINGRLNIGAHYYDDSELDQAQQDRQQIPANGVDRKEIPVGDHYNGSNMSLSLHDEAGDHQRREDDLKVASNLANGIAKKVDNL